MVARPLSEVSVGDVVGPVTVPVSRETLVGYANASLDQNPIPHSRVRVLCPDGVEREYETDDEGEIFLPRTGKDVYTLVEVLQDCAPMSLSVPGTWNVDVIPDDPT